MSEQVIADFSGGMNLTPAVDKLLDKECLRADNCRFTELGSVVVGGASTKQNTVAYGDASGDRQVHSLWLNPTISHIVGIGNDVFAGLDLNSLSSVVVGANSSMRKMSFCDYADSVFYDANTVPRYTSSTGLHLTVDWSNSASVAVGPTNGGTFTNVQYSAFPTSSPWISPALVQTLDGAFSQNTFTPGIAGDYLRISNFGFAIPSTGTLTGIKVEITRKASSGIISDKELSIMLAGVPASRDKASNVAWGASVSTVSYGGDGDLWGFTHATPADINGSGFGISFRAQQNPINSSAVAAVDNIRVTIYYRPSFIATASATAGVLNGTYTYKHSFVDENGYESEAFAAAASVSPANKKVDLSAIAVGDSRTVQRKIYRKGGKLTAYYWVADISDNVTTAYTDNTSDDDVLTNAIILAGEIEGDFANSRLGAAKVAAFPEEFYDRLFWINQEPGHENEIFWSKPINPFAYPVEFFFAVGDGKPVTRVVRFHEDLIIFKTDSIWRLSGKQEDEFDLIRLPSNQGCDMPFTIVRLESEILFCNSNGLFSFDGIGVRFITNRLEPFFRNYAKNGVNPIVKPTGINLTYEAAYSNGTYYLSYADTGTANNRIMLVDREKFGTVNRDTRTALSICKDPVQDKILFGDDTGFIRQLDAGPDDSGGPVNWKFQSKFYDQKRNSRKVYDHLEFDIDTSGQPVTPIVHYNGGNDSETLAPITTAQRAHVGRSLSLPASKIAYNISIELSAAIQTINEAQVPAVQFNQVKVTFAEREQRSRTANA